MDGGKVVSNRDEWIGSDGDNRIGRISVNNGDKAMVTFLSNGHKWTRRTARNEDIRLG